MDSAFVFIKNYWRSILTAIVIFILTIFTAGDLSKIPELPLIERDKLAHFGVFYIMATFLIVDLQKKTDFTLKKILIIVFIICFLHGGSIELIQHFFLEYREGSILDMLANILGCLFACIIQPKFRLLRY